MRYRRGYDSELDDFFSSFGAVTRGMRDANQAAFAREQAIAAQRENRNQENIQRGTLALQRSFGIAPEDSSELPESPRAASSSSASLAPPGSPRGEEGSPPSSETSPSQTPLSNEQPADPVRRMIASRPEVPVGAPLPGERPLERGAALLGEVRQASGAPPSAPITRANWNAYLEQLVELYRRNGATPEQLNQVLQNTERQRIRGLQATVSMAVAAMSAGDLDTATRALNAGQQYVPDGIRTQFQPDGRGGIMMTRQSETNPDQVTRTRVTPQQAEQFALRMLDPKWSLEYEMRRRESDSTLATAAQARELALRAESRAQAAEGRNQILFDRRITEEDAAREAFPIGERIAQVQQMLRQPLSEEQKNTLQQELRDLTARFDAAISRAGVTAQNTIFDNMRAAEDSASRRAERDRQADEARRADAAEQAFQAVMSAERAHEAAPTDETKAALAAASSRLNEALAVAPAETNRRIVERMARMNQQAFEREMMLVRAERQKAQAKLAEARAELEQNKGRLTQDRINEINARINMWNRQLELQEQRMANTTAALALRENQITIEQINKFSSAVNRVLDGMMPTSEIRDNVNKWAVSFYALNPRSDANQITATLAAYYSLPVRERGKAFEYKNREPYRFNIEGAPRLLVPEGFGPSLPAPPNPNEPMAPAMQAPATQAPATQAPAAGRASLRGTPAAPGAPGTPTQQPVIVTPQPRRALPPGIADAPSLDPNTVMPRAPRMPREVP
jgi:hypothetical protein